MTIRDRAPDPHAHLPSRSKPVSRRSNPKIRRTSKRISLALQGGGSLGAFTWGVLDRLLEEDDLTFDAISGASAGAMNAVVVGWSAGWREA
jgi:NTE family protein